MDDKTQTIHIYNRSNDRNEQIDDWRYPEDEGETTKSSR